MWEALKRVFVGGQLARPRSEAESQDWIIFLGRAILFGLLLAIAIGYLSGETPSEGIQRGLVATMVSMAALFLGGVIGFLFGIPRAQSGQIADAGALADKEDLQRRYLENTNLEQISDWLTKIIIGISLVQFNAIVTQISGFAGKVAPAFLPEFGGSEASVAFVWLLFFGIVGFLFSYLWTRVIMVHVLTQSNATLVAELAKAINNDAGILSAVEEYMDGIDSADTAAAIRIRKLVSEAPFSARQQIFNHARDWRKRRWQERDFENLERALPIFGGLIDAAPEGFHRNYGQYAYVLKDKTNPEWVEAIGALEHAIAIRNESGASGYAIYEANLADCIIAIDTDFNSGNPSESEKSILINDLVETAKATVDLTKYERIQKWLAINPSE